MPCPNSAHVPNRRNDGVIGIGAYRRRCTLYFAAFTRLFQSKLRVELALNIVRIGFDSLLDPSPGNCRSAERHECSDDGGNWLRIRRGDTRRWRRNRCHTRERDHARREYGARTNERTVKARPAAGYAFSVNAETSGSIAWTEQNQNLWIGQGRLGEYDVYRVLTPQADPKFPWAVVTADRKQFLAESGEQGKWLCEIVDMSGGDD